MKFTLREMKTYPLVQSLGFFDVELRVPWLEAKGNPLSRLEAVIGWEGFRLTLEGVLTKPAKGPGGRPANDPIIGWRRNAAAIGLLNLIYNLARCEQMVRLKLRPRIAA